MMDVRVPGMALILVAAVGLSVDEVAAMATYVAGKLSSATNGAALRVDGGVVRALE
jgi:enoyl-[acyl-carrier-protein] reductase (NADH)